MSVPLFGLKSQDKGSVRGGLDLGQFSKPKVGNIDFRGPLVPPQHKTPTQYSPLQSLTFKAKEYFGKLVKIFFRFTVEISTPPETEPYKGKPF